MHFKLVVAFVEDEITKEVVQAARNMGAKGATIISSARGEGLETPATFLGLDLISQRDVLLFVVEEHRCRAVLEHIAEVGQFEERPGTGIAIQVDIEDAIGISRQAEILKNEIGDEL